MNLRIALAATVVSFAVPALAQQAAETLNYAVEWRFVRAGDVQVKWSGSSNAELQLKTTGIVASIGSGAPVVMLRTDIDALPVEEPEGFEARSQVKSWQNPHHRFF